MSCRVGTIREVHQQLLSDGCRVTEYALRKWIQDGTIPSVRSGKKIFITYAHVVEFLTTGTIALEPIAIIKNISNNWRQQTSAGNPGGRQGPKHCGWHQGGHQENGFSNCGEWTLPSTTFFQSG